MIRAESETVIARCPEQVFDFVVTGFFDNYPRWSPEIEELERTSPPPLCVGSTGRQVRVDHGRRTETTFVVSELEPGRRAVFKGTSHAFRIIYDFEPTADGTRLRFVFELDGINRMLRPFERLIRRVVQHGAARIAEDIRDLVETETVDGDPARGTQSTARR